MNRRLRMVGVVTLVCLAIGLSANALLNRYLRLDHDRLNEGMKTTAVTDEQPSLLDLKVVAPNDLILALESPENFRIMHRVSDIPESVRTAFGKAIQESGRNEKFSMAEAGAWPWNVSDAIRGGLPRRRLKAVAASTGHFLVFYERGGFAKSDDVAAFRASGREAYAIWHSSFNYSVANPAELRIAIRGQKYGDAFY